MLHCYSTEAFWEMWPIVLHDYANGIVRRKKEAQPHLLPLPHPTPSPPHPTHRPVHVLGSGPGPSLTRSFSYPDEGQFWKPMFSKLHDTSKRMEENQGNVCCKNNICWEYEHLYWIIMPTEGCWENKRPVHTAHTCATYLLLAATNHWKNLWFGSDNGLIQQHMTAIHTLDRIHLFSWWYILAKIPKLHQSNLKVCKHTTARCQQMHHI